MDIFIIINYVLFFVLFVVLLVSLTYSYYKTNSVSSKDTTDPENGVSHLTLYTDYGTGVQYLKFPGGTVLPRIDYNGELYSDYAEQDVSSKS